MILQYYGFFPGSNIQARADIMALYGNMGGSVANIADPAWENREQVKRMFREATSAPADILYPDPDATAFSQFFQNKFLSYLSYGHPLQAGIVGPHIIVVRGAVIKRDGREFWAICNDPYGMLASPSSDYTKSLPTNKDHWYYRGIPGGLSSSRKDRNATGDGVGQQYKKGKHVYYNDTVHTRTDEKTAGTHFNFRYAIYIPYRNTNDIAIMRKDYVKGKLIHGI
jgi:hypothetical protein